MVNEVVEKENIFLFVPNIIGECHRVFSLSFSLFVLLICRNCVITVVIDFIFIHRFMIYSKNIYTIFYNDTIWCDAIKWSDEFPFPFFHFPRTSAGYTRMVLAVIAFYFMQTHYILAGWCYIVSALLDAIDGHAARALNQSE